MRDLWREKAVVSDATIGLLCRDMELALFQMGIMADMGQGGVRHEVLPYVVMLTCTALPPLVLALISVFGDHSVPAGRCEGLGWGCVLSPASTARLLLLFVLPAMVVWSAGAMVALALLQR